MQQDINKETGKIFALQSGKNDKYEYLTGKDILPSDQSIIIEQAKFTYSCFGKASFEKQIKITKDQGDKQIKAIENRVKKNSIYRPKSISIPFKKYFSTKEEALCELNKIREIEQDLILSDFAHLSQ